MKNKRNQKKLNKIISNLKFIFAMMLFIFVASEPVGDYTVKLILLKIVALGTIFILYKKEMK